MTNHAAWACESAARTYLGLEPGELVRRGSLGRRSAASHRSCSFVSCPLSKFAGVQMLLLISSPHPLTGHRLTTATEPTRDTHAERGQQQGLEQSACRGGSFRFGCAESNRLKNRGLRVCGRQRGLCDLFELGRTPAESSCTPQAEDACVHCLAITGATQSSLRRLHRCNAAKEGPEDVGDGGGEEGSVGNAGGRRRDRGRNLQNERRCECVTCARGV